MFSQVTKLLQGIGIEKIDHVTVMSDPNNIELNRGFAFLELESIKDAQNAYKKLQKKGIFGKHLNIKVAWAEPLIEPDESELNKVSILVFAHIESYLKLLNDTCYCLIYSLYYSQLQVSFSRSVSLFLFICIVYTWI